MTAIDSIYFEHDLMSYPDTVELSTYETFRHNEWLALYRKSRGTTDSMQFLDLKITRPADSLFYFLDQNTRFDTMDLVHFTDFVQDLIDSLGTDHYWVAKCYGALANQYYYLYFDIYRSYDFYKRALAIFQGLPWVGHEQIYLLCELVQKSVAHREYLQGKAYGLKAVDLSSKYFQKDTVLNALAQGKTGLIKMGIGDPDYSNFFESALHLLAPTSYNALYQEVLKYSIFLGFGRKRKATKSYQYLAP